MPLDREQQERERKLEEELRHQAAGYGRLSADEERRLLAHLPDAGAARSLVEHNLDVVVDQAEAHLGRGLQFSDLYQEGSVGLVDAVSAYAGQGDFRDFASLHVGLQIDALIEEEAQARQEGEDDVRDLRTLDMAQVMFRRDNGRPAKAGEMQRLLGWDEGRLERIERMLEVARERNDAATLSALDDADTDELGIDFTELPPDPRRRPQGAGPDE
jgi:DNA-directed RNA polymerase sigma subunit (sigma70/sigma32)